MAPSLKFLQPKAITDRPQWGHRLDFFFVLLGAGIVQGSFYTSHLFAYYGGGAILFTMLLFVIFIIFPMNYLQVTIGQITGRGVLEFWETLCPMLKGLGYGCLILTFSMICIVNHFLGLYLFYLYSAISSSGTNSTLPWMTCDNPWNTNKCKPILKPAPTKAPVLVPNPSIMNMTSMSDDGQPKSMSAQEFLLFQANNEDPNNLSASFGISDRFNWWHALASTIGWCLVCIFVFKGIRVIGKAMYALVLIPIVLALVLVIMLSTQPGAGTGMKYMMYPNFIKASEPYAIDAVLRSLIFVFDVPSSIMVSLASYNHFNRRSVFDCLGISVIAGLLPFLFNGLTFMAHGVMAFYLGAPMLEVASFGGIGGDLGSTICGIGLLPSSTVATILFLLMNIVRMWSYQICLMENIVTGFLDVLGNHGWKKRAIVTSVTVVLGLFFIFITSTNTSRHIIYFVDMHFASFFVPFYMILFIFAVAYNFGSYRIVGFIGIMYDYVCCSKFLRVMWKYATIVTAVQMFIKGVFSSHRINFYFPITNGGYQQYTDTMNHMANFCIVICFLPMLLFFFVPFIRSPGDFKTRCLSMVRPHWMADQVARMNWNASWARKKSVTEDGTTSSYCTQTTSMN